MAECGLGSRRRCEQLIACGQVFVDGQPVTQQGVQIDPQTQTVCVAGRSIQAERKRYIMLNKPRGVLCTSHDPQGRRIFKDLLDAFPERVFTVGRLDRDSEGLLLITNDGELSNRLIHPRYHVAKTYHVWVDGAVSAAAMIEMCKGMRIDNESMRMAHIQLLHCEKDLFVYEVELKQGKKRQIRRMMMVVGCSVKRLVRVKMGPLRLGLLKCGLWRDLKPGEIRALQQAAGLEEMP